MNPMPVWSRLVTSFGALEELLPFTDFVPTATISCMVSQVSHPFFVFHAGIVGILGLSALSGATPHLFMYF